MAGSGPAMTILEVVQPYPAVSSAALPGTRSMLYFASWKVLLICAVCALGVIASLPNLFTPTQLAHLPNFIPHKQVALGLDLRGGSYLLLEVDVAAAQHEHLNTIVDNVRNALRDANIGYTG